MKLSMQFAGVEISYKLLHQSWFAVSAITKHTQPFTKPANFSPINDYVYGLTNSATDTTAQYIFTYWSNHIY